VVKLKELKWLNYACIRRQTDRDKALALQAQRQQTTSNDEKKAEVTHLNGTPPQNNSLRDSEGRTRLK